VIVSQCEAITKQYAKQLQKAGFLSNI
jgi:hypothetical protein